MNNTLRKVQIYGLAETVKIAGESKSTPWLGRLGAISKLCSATSDRLTSKQPWLISLKWLIKKQQSKLPTYQR